MPADYRILESQSRTGRPSLYDHMEANPSLCDLIASQAANYRGAFTQGSWAMLDPADVGRDMHRYMTQYMPQSAYASLATLVDAPDKTTLTKGPAVTAEELSLDDPRRKLAVDAEMLLGYQPLLKDTKAPGRLRRALADLEIEVLDQISVDAYKAQMVRHYASHQKMSDPTWRIKPLRGYGQPVPEHVLAKAVEIKRVLPEAEFYVDQLAVDPFLIVSLVKIEDFRTNQPTRGLDPETAAYVEVWDEPKFEGRV